MSSSAGSVIRHDKRFNQEDEGKVDENDVMRRWRIFAPSADSRRSGARRTTRTENLSPPPRTKIDLDHGGRNPPPVLLTSALSRQNDPTFRNPKSGSRDTININNLVLLRLREEMLPASFNKYLGPTGDRYGMSIDLLSSRRLDVRYDDCSSRVWRENGALLGVIL